MWFFEFFFLGLCPDWIRELWGSTDCYILNEWSWTSYTNYHCWLGLQQWILCQWNNEKKEYKVFAYILFFFFLFEKLLSDDLLFVERKALQSCKQWGNSLWQWLICIWEILRNEEIKEMGKFISYSFGWLHWESGCWRALNGDKIRKCCLFFLPGF